MAPRWVVAFRPSSSPAFAKSSAPVQTERTNSAPRDRALILAKAGLLDGLEATTHHGATDLLRQVAPKTTVHADRRFVDNGRVVCSAGIAAGIDMSLHVVARLLGRGVTETTARQMEYPWQP